MPAVDHDTLMKFTAEGQDPVAVEDVMDKMRNIITPKEKIIAIFVQQKIALCASVTLTNERIIFHRPTILGGAHIEEYYWKHVGKARIAEGPIHSTFYLDLRKQSGLVDEAPVTLGLGFLPKAQALKLYSLAKEQDMYWNDEWRRRGLEEKIATSGGFPLMDGDWSGVKHSYKPFVGFVDKKKEEAPPPAPAPEPQKMPDGSYDMGNGMRVMGRYVYPNVLSSQYDHMMQGADGQYPQAMQGQVPPTGPQPQPQYPQYAQQAPAPAATEAPMAPPETSPHHNIHIPPAPLMPESSPAAQPMARSGPYFPGAPKQQEEEQSPSPSSSEPGPQTQEAPAQPALQPQPEVRPESTPVPEPPVAREEPQPVSSPLPESADAEPEAKAPEPQQPVQEQESESASPQAQSPQPSPEPTPAASTSEPRKPVAQKEEAKPASPEASSEPASNLSPMERFKQLKELLDQGFISKEEYNQKRSQIISSI